MSNFLFFFFFCSLYALDIRPLLDVWLVKMFSHSIVYHFVPMMVSFAIQNLFSFMRSLLLIVLSACAVGFLIRKYFPVPINSRLSPDFSSNDSIKLPLC